MNVPAWPQAVNRASTRVRAPWPSRSQATACRATSDSTAGENSAAAKPISSTAPITAQVRSA